MTTAPCSRHFGDGKPEAVRGRRRPCVRDRRSSRRSPARRTRAGGRRAWPGRRAASRPAAQPNSCASGADEQRRIGGAPGDDDVGASRQRLDDRLGADVGVGRDEPIAERRDRLAGLGDRELAAGRPTSSTSSPVTAATVRPPSPSRRARSRDARRRPRRIGRAHVGDDGDAAFAARRQHGLACVRRAADRSRPADRAPCACCASAIVRSARHSNTR